MIILGIEAAAKVAGAAVYRDGQIVAEQMVNGTLTHSETLMPMVDAVLKAANMQPKELDAIALTAGPGSFTGLRIGAATAKGLALGLNIPLIPICTLEGLAANMGPTDHLIVPMMDARRNQVYTAIYDYEKGEVMAPEAMAPADLAVKLQELGRPVVVLGDGSALYVEKLRELSHVPVVLAPAHLRHASAGTVAALGAKKYEQGQSISGSQLELNYLRKPQAEREREERLAREHQG
ncbi:MAG: tRNA (adenosine(37)-N6)-threonylcarbamoyltransferase complex dimerization subunit type 1 TsaB [Firmicutes bacterium]|nr:tRNA (adenosine(37)-N6)-threonylcarbamoyltransferase complex dimerization subunit type 1 TsaB [Bacillota bacterium]